MNLFQVGIPNLDSSGNSVQVLNLESAMEPLSSDGNSHFVGQDTRWHSGSFIDQCSIFFWLIPDTNLASAKSAYETFISGFTFANPPYEFSFSISQ